MPIVLEEEVPLQPNLENKDLISETYLHKETKNGVLPEVKELDLPQEESMDITDDFKDMNFRAKILEKYDKNGDGRIQENEVAEVEMLSVESASIKNISGIEHFANLTELDCSFNEISILPDKLPIGLTTFIFA